MAVVWSLWNPMPSQQIVIRMGIKGLCAILRTDSWTEQGLHRALLLGKFTQWYSTHGTSGMLLQPHVYAGHVEGVPTVGENTQYIFAMVFCKANCAPATDNNHNLLTEKCDIAEYYKTGVMNKKNPQGQRQLICWAEDMNMVHSKPSCYLSWRSNSTSTRCFFRSRLYSM